MIHLSDINEQNYLDAASLRVREDQQGYLDRPVGILARGYVYRAANARVFGIAEDGRLIGLALVKDMDEEPACYDLQQFMIDERWQNRGFGSEALRQVLALLRREGKYGCVEVCVKQDNAQALRVYEKLGFADTGYRDEDAPDCLNLRVSFAPEDTPSDK